MTREWDETEVRRRFFDDLGRLREHAVESYIRDHGGEPALFTALLAVAGQLDPGLIGATRDVALLLARFEDWQPDLPGLFVLFRRAGSPRPFVAWAASRAGVDRVVIDLGTALRSEDEGERIDAMALVDEAVRYARWPEPPRFGGGGQSEKYKTVAAHVEGALPRHELAGSKGLEPDLIPITPGGDGVAVKAVATHEARPIRDRIVNVEFAPADDPGTSLEEDEPLRPGMPYFFFVGVAAERSAHSIDDPHAPPLPSYLEEGMVLTVAVFDLEGGLRLTEGADVGELRILPDGSVVVARQPLRDDGAVSEARRNTWLVFPVQAPDREGPARMRCSIYHRQVLLQSRLVTAEVRGGASRCERSLRAEVDYALVQRLRPEGVRGLSAHRLSVMVNDDGEGTHAVHILGGDGAQELKQTIRMQNLSVATERARRALRKAAWDTEEPWDRRPPRYDDDRADLDRLTRDLVHLAFRGRDFYNVLAGGLAGEAGTSIYDARSRMAALLKEPADIQIAMLDSAMDLFPGSLVYDYPLKQVAADYKLCDTFASAVRKRMAPEGIDCFSGRCVQGGPEAHTDVVCPGGFWGFRHRVGLPLSLQEDDVPADLPFREQPKATAGVCTDLALLAVHENRLRALFPGGGWTFARRRTDVIQSLRSGEPQLIYFYCHGGSEVGTPYLIVGPDCAPGITPSDLVEEKLRWASRPLVFMNGCETAALQPDEITEFVTFFIRDARACGVMGTEITVFERWAGTFAEVFLKGFLIDYLPVGEAVRRARVQLLVERGNPLGLAYRPLVLASLQLRQT